MLPFVRFVLFVVGLCLLVSAVILVAPTPEGMRQPTMAAFALAAGGLVLLVVSLIMGGSDAPERPLPSSRGRAAASPVPAAPARDAAPRRPRAPPAPPALSGRIATYASYRDERHDVAGLFGIGLRPVASGVRLELLAIFRGALPVWARMASDTIELVPLPGKGTPTTLRVFMDLARELRVFDHGTNLTELHVPQLQELVTAAEVAAARATGAALIDALRGAALVKHLVTFAGVCGYRLELTHVGEERRATHRIGRLLGGFHRPYWDGSRDGQTRRAAFFTRFPQLTEDSRLEMDWSLTFVAAGARA